VLWQRGIRKLTRLLPVAIPGAALIGGLYSGSVLGGPQPERLESEIVVTARRLEDAALAARMLSVLAQDPYLFADHVSVSAESGVVRVSGVVQDLPDLYAILRLARRIAGTRRVVNEIVYQPNDDDGN